jgi:hypothetical protein
VGSVSERGRTKTERAFENKVLKRLLEYEGRGVVGGWRKLYEELNEHFLKICSE